VPAIRFLRSMLATARHYLLYSDISYTYVDFIYILTDLVIQSSSISRVLHCKYTGCVSSCI
jgi:hypothetical protein